jgi:hypothetical protein
MIGVKSGNIKSLEDRPEEESVKRMLEDRLIALKLEEPELFYMTQEERARSQIPGRLLLYVLSSVLLILVAVKPWGKAPPKI